MYYNSLVNASNPKSKNTSNKGVSSIYYKKNEITSLKKQVNLDYAYAIVAKKFEKKVNNFMKGTKQRQLTNEKTKRSSVSSRNLF